MFREKTPHWLKKPEGSLYEELVRSLARHLPRVRQVRPIITPSEMKSTSFLINLSLKYITTYGAEASLSMQMQSLQYIYISLIKELQFCNELHEIPGTKRSDKHFAFLSRFSFVEQVMQNSAINSFIWYRICRV